MRCCGGVEIHGESKEEMQRGGSMKDMGANVNNLTEKIIGAAIEVHRHLGPASYLVVNL